MFLLAAATTQALWHSGCTLHLRNFAATVKSFCAEYAAGMFTIVTVLVVVDRISPKKAEKLARWFDPAILWIQRWLGAFYVPSLAVLPLTIQGIAGWS